MNSKPETPETIEDVRAALFAALRGIKDGTMTAETARLTSEISQVLINTAKVEIDYLKVNGGGESRFIETPVDPLPQLGLTGVTRHLIQG